MHQRKEESQGKQSLIRWEEGHQAHQLAQIDILATRKIQGNYGFILNTNISTHLNACHVLGDIPTGVDFAHFTNKHFHNLTTKKIIPATVATVLGFGLKFIPIPKKSIHQDDVDKAVKRFNQDFYLKVFFADNDTNSDDEEPIEKLQVNSVWKPDQPPTRLLNALEILKEPLQETSAPNAENPTLRSSKPPSSSRYAATKIVSLPTPTRT
jgi:hypothetical protein